ncbi:hypothetical protein JKP88DRAFT_337240 [Tribonema minus]|uniref:Uncharacterized protein n=1 Tax=Tribonema minus TaxID=303371 RepID=A0A835YI68_9STRA|nr:hypothetical protein JKP88DRAFT_337240 [Tribonema minus]
MPFVCACGIQQGDGASVDGVVATLVCISCCKGGSDRAPKVNRRAALELVSASALDRLGYQKNRNRKKTKALHLRLYLKAEVTALALHAQNVKKAMAEERQRQLSFSIEEVPASLRDYVLEDFLHHVKRPKTSNRRVEQRHKAARLATQAALILYKGPIVPLANFCLERPLLKQPAVVASRVSLHSDLRDSALPREGVRIATFLATMHRQMACISIPALEAALDAALANRKESLRVEVIRSGGGAEWVDDPACERRLERFMTHMHIDAAETAAKIVAFHRTRGDAAARRALLQTAMDRRRVALCSDSKFCASFINGTVDVDPEEVAAIADITARIFLKGGHILYSHCSKMPERACLREVYEFGKSWDQGVLAAMHVAGSYRADAARDYDRYGYDRYDRW